MTATAASTGKPLAGKHCVITGASRGLGAHLAREFAGAGASLTLVSRDVDALRHVVADISLAPGQTVRALRHDLCDAASVDALVAEIRALPRLDVLINNAAMHGQIGPAWTTSWDSWNQTLQTNLMAPVALCRAAVATMLGHGSGSIINISGGGATGSRPRFAAYATAKTGLVRFSEILSDEAREHGIRVNCVAPGAMATSMLREVIDNKEAAGAREAALAASVFENGGSPLQEVAALCLFLAGDESTGVSGKLISAQWDPWRELGSHLSQLQGTDVYTLRRIVPKERGMDWGDKQ